MFSTLVGTILRTFLQSFLRLSHSIPLVAFKPFWNALLVLSNSRIGISQTLFGDFFVESSLCWGLTPRISYSIRVTKLLSQMCGFFHWPLVSGINDPFLSALASCILPCPSSLTSLLSLSSTHTQTIYCDVLYRSVYLWHCYEISWPNSFVFSSHWKLGLQEMLFLWFGLERPMLLLTVILHWWT